MNYPLYIPGDTGCGNCRHTFDDHGDRAVVACDGGCTTVTGNPRPRLQSDPPGKSMCGCPGWHLPEGI